jgi:hypothetical protein
LHVSNSLSKGVRFGKSKNNEEVSDNTKDDRCCKEDVESGEGD